MMTTMPDKIYIESFEFEDPLAGIKYQQLWVKEHQDGTQYTRSDLCVPRSEYDKLKQQADRLAEMIDFFHKELITYQDAGLCEYTVTPFFEETKTLLEEYRKETE